MFGRYAKVSGAPDLRGGCQAHTLEHLRTLGPLRTGTSAPEPSAPINRSRCAHQTSIRPTLSSGGRPNNRKEAGTNG